MIATSMLPFSSPAPAINATETRWVAEELAILQRQVAPDSPAALVLRQARQELDSLVRSAESEVIGPFRVNAAA